MIAARPLPRVLLLLCLGSGAALFAGMAWAFWTGSGSGAGPGAATTLIEPGTPTLSQANGTVTVSWTATTAPGPGAVDYSVQRRDESGPTWVDACGTTATTRINALTCDEVPGAGLYAWRVTAHISSWTATSSESNGLMVDNPDLTPPTGSITAPSAGSIVRGSVTVSSDSADAESGVASALFQRSPAGINTWTNIAVADTTAPFSASWNTATPGDDLYDLRVITADNVGNSFTSPLVTSVRVDNTVPTVSLALVSGATGAYMPGTVVFFKANAAGSFSLVATVTDGGSGAASATFPVLSATNWTTHAAQTVSTPTGGPYASSTLSWISGASAPGTYTTTATDAAGNTVTRAITFTIDNTAPTGSITAPAASANVRGTVTVTSSSADARSGVASAQFQISPAGAGTWSNLGAADTLTPFAATWDTTTFAEGLYDQRVITTDNVGNTFTSATIANVRVDNTTPTGSVTAPLSDALIKGTIIVTSDSADAESGVASALFQRSPADTATWTNIATADTTAPFTASWNTASPGTGFYDLRVMTTDKAGNTYTSILVTSVWVDNTAPTGSITSPAASANVRGTITITSNSADVGSGVASAQFQSSPQGAGTWTNLDVADTISPYSGTWDTTTFTDGLYSLRVITTDNAGNTLTSGTIGSVRVDNTAPTGAITAPLSSAKVKGTVTVTSSSADGGSGVANALFQSSPAGAGTWTNIAVADTTLPYSASWVTTGYVGGLYDLQVITTDKADNTFTSALATNVRVDNTAPTVSVAVTSPVGAFQSSQKIYFKANAAGSFGFLATVTDGGSGPASALFPALSATNWTTHAAETVTTPVGGPYASSTLSWISGAAAPGTFTVTAADGSGNTVTSAFTFTIDSTAPTGSITAPAASANVRGTVTVTSSSADARSGVASAQFQISPAGAGTWSNLGAADTLTPFAATWDTTTFAEGFYDQRVITTDNVGNTFTSATIANVRVDNTAPTGSITAPAPDAFVKGATVAVSANAADTGSGVLNSQFQTSPTGTNTWANLGAAATTAPYGVTWNTSGYPDGRHDLRVVTADKAGNTFTSPTVTVEVQNSGPTANAMLLVDVGGTGGMIEQGDAITVTYSQTIRVSTLCSTWSGDVADQSLNVVSDVTVTVTDGGASNDTLTITSATCTFHFGSVDLGATGYVTSGSNTFSGSTDATKSTIAWNATTHTLTVTLGQAGGAGTIGTVGSSNATYTPDAAIMSGIGTAITGTFSTGALTQF